MRITHLVLSFPGGGKEKRLLQLIQGMNERGYNDIQLIIIDNVIDYPEIYDTSARLDIVNISQKTRNPFKICCQLRKLIADYNPDIVQVWGVLASLYLDFAFLRKKFKYVLSYVADCNKPKMVSIENVVNKISVHRSDAVIGNSLAGLTAYSIPIDKAHCIYNGYNSKRKNKVCGLNILDKKNELSIDTRFVVSMIGRVCEHKDFKCYIDIARIILQHRDDVTFLAIGKGPQLEYYKSLLSDQEKDKIRFLGFRNDTDELLMITDISVLCTNFINHQEGVSNVILESMYLGKPVLATHGGGSPEIITDGVDGYLIKENNVNDFVDKLELLLNDDLTYTQFSNHAITKVEEKFSLEKSVDAYINLYKCLC